MKDSLMILDPLRQDLKIFKNEKQKDGSPSWVIFDPVRKNYYQINPLEFLIISNWTLKDPEKIIIKIKQESTYFPTLNDITEVANFLTINGLLDATFFYKKEQNNFTNFSFLNFDKLYFYKIPLFNPSKFLLKFDTVSTIFFNKYFYYLFGFIFLLSSYLILREWDSYKNQFSYFFTFEGIVLGFFALLLSKLVHEFGHAIAARRYGLSVEEMGVNLIVFWPIFYTDTSHAWRLSSRYQKMIIDSAGVIAELMLAVFSTLLWAITPEGYYKGMLWSLSSTTWIITLFVNLNPLMKFDGYYLLSDFLATPNLMSRSILIFNIKLKNIFFEPKKIFPEKKSIKWFTFYGGLCSGYRFFLYISIAYAAYIFYFKFLGILLFLGIIFKMIFISLYIEIREIFSQKKQKFSKKSYLIFVLLILFFLPLPSYLRLPAVLVAENNAIFYSPISAKVSDILVQDGDYVEANQLLIQLINPDLHYKKELIEVRLSGLTNLQKGEVAKQSLLERNQVTSQVIAEAVSELEGLKTQIERLSIRSNYSGFVKDIKQDLMVGSWVKNSDSLLKVVNDSELFLESYIHESELSNLQINQLGNAYLANDIFNSIRVKVVDIDRARTIDFEKLSLSIDFGGNVPIIKTPKGSFATHGAYYKIRLKALEPVIRNNSNYIAHVVLENGWNSFLGKHLNNFLSILIRESGF